MRCFARVVRAVLGDGSLAARKLEHGESLVILGVEVHMSVDSYMLRPSRDKVAKCVVTIHKALESGCLHKGDAQKLAGRLSWSTQHIFHKLGRAMLRPIFDQKFARDVGIGPALATALKWWLQVLETDIVEERAWRTPELPPARLFVDARSTPPRCAAVLFINGQTLYTDGEPHASVMEWFQQRADGQITALEILAISVGLSTFSEELAGRKVVIYSDNTGAEVRRLTGACWEPRVTFPCQGAVKRGSSRTWDTCCIIHEIWTMVCVVQVVVCVAGRTCVCVQSGRRCRMARRFG